MSSCQCLAGPTGFEPAISSVTGRRDRPASLRAQKLPVGVFVDAERSVISETTLNNYKLLKPPLWLYMGVNRVVMTITFTGLEL